MRKKSHISLAGYLLKNLNVDSLDKHRKAFYLGSILPDIMPSFLTRRHTIEDTFDILKKQIERLTGEKSLEKGMTMAYCRRLGVITHYVADYFTFPHNSVFEGSLKEHCRYEADLMASLKAYVKSAEAARARAVNGIIRTKEDIIHLIERMHKEYLECIKNIKNDINYIVELCYRVVDAILQIFERYQEGIAA
ncbi:MAG: zinc dependent phospholipase C family protein [Lachnospiraceae bacterium]